MNKKTTSIKSLTLLITLFFAVSFGYGQSIFDNPIIGTNPGLISPFTSGQYKDPNITVSGISRGSGILGNNANDRYNARGWNTEAIDLTAYFEFTITPNSGYEIDFVSFVYTSQRSNASISNFAIRYSLDGFTNNIATPVYIGPSNPVTIDLSSASYQNITSSITFRFYAWGAASTNNTFSINDFTFNGAVSASNACVGGSKTWNGSSWIPSGAPGPTNEVFIEGPYSTAANGSINACSLTVRNNATLNVDNNTFVEVQNNITVNTLSSFVVQPYGSVIQIDNLGTRTNNGTTRVVKTTAILNKWYEYTYWSSPVSGETIANGLFDSEPNRRFKFNGQNFLDHCAETGNNNTLICDDGSGNGVQDGIDDDNNDWQWVSGTTVMQPGVGYAATHSEAVFIFPGVGYDYSFEGPFNNGIYNVPIYRNDSELNDDNWNFIGNPYPSAIDADLFLTANTAISKDVISPKSIDGAIFLWSQNTAPSATENGNQVLNFATADYAIINGIGQVAGGDGITPSRKIPSGQGFFVSMSNAAAATLVSGQVWTTNVVFNNSMRVRGASDNSQFFKDSNTKDKNSSTNTNKLWVNLTSDNGVFNQTLIGYVDGATNNYDGAYYDAVKNLSAGASAILYSTIEGLNKVFAIQGRTASTLNENEVINLGFNTSINVPTIYTLSIAQLEGEFLSNNKVYLKDNLLNTLHELSASDYNFTSEVGAFKDRFEIVFNSQALSADTFNLDANAVQIIQVDDTHVTFKASNNLNIKTVAIYDLLGRQLYQLEGSHHEETYNLSNLNHSVFIAKIELSNGALITKKAIKK